MTDYFFKICIFGDGGVGKSTFIERFLTGIFDTNLVITIGANFHTKHLEIDGLQITLQIWDLAGEENFRAILPKYINGSSGGIFMFDVTRLSSLNNVDAWLEVVRQNIAGIPLLMLASKIDHGEERSIQSESAMELATQKDFYAYGECSSKSGIYIEEAFELLTRAIMEYKNII